MPEGTKVMMMNSAPLEMVERVRESREEELHELYTKLIISNKRSCRNSKQIMIETTTETTNIIKQFSKRQRKQTVMTRMETRATP
jgi:hypothetical protein